MTHYRKRFLNILLDAYERSLLSIGENKVNIQVSIPFTPKTIPEYFDESSFVYEDIHACLEQLQQEGFLKIIWKKGKADNIIQKVVLQEERVEEVYCELERVPKEEKRNQSLSLLKDMGNQVQTPVCARFIERMISSLEERKAVGEYLDIEDPEGTRKLLRAIMLIEENMEKGHSMKEHYLREFSIIHFSDSKYIESVAGRIAKVFKNFAPEMKGLDAYEILAEYSIYHTPNFVYFKGQGVIEVDGERLNLRVFREGIGLTGNAVSCLSLREFAGIEKVITIENLTTFFRWQEEDSLIIYLGGYHNKLRRQLLQIIYQTMPEVDYYHFGDIDCGGFHIYESLCEKTGIEFRPYYMDIDTFRKFKKFSKPLTENDRKNISKMLEDKPAVIYAEVLREMLKSGKKLEQECIFKISH